MPIILYNNNNLLKLCAVVITEAKATMRSITALCKSKQCWLMAATNEYFNCRLVWQFSIFWLNSFVYIMSGNWKMPIIISQSPRWPLEVACSTQITVKPPPNIQFTLIYHKEKSKQMLTLEKSRQCFALIDCNQICCWLTAWGLTDWLIDYADVCTLFQHHIIIYFKSSEEFQEKYLRTPCEMLEQANNSQILPLQVKQLAHSICRLEQSVAIYSETLHHHDAVRLFYNYIF